MERIGAETHPLLPEMMAYSPSEAASRSPPPGGTEGFLGNTCISSPPNRARPAPPLRLRASAYSGPAQGPSPASAGRGSQRSISAGISRSSGIFFKPQRSIILKGSSADSNKPIKTHCPSSFQQIRTTSRETLAASIFGYIFVVGCSDVRRCLDHWFVTVR